MHAGTIYAIQNTLLSLFSREKHNTMQNQRDSGLGLERRNSDADASLNCPRCGFDDRRVSHVGRKACGWRSRGLDVVHGALDGPSTATDRGSDPVKGSRRRCDPLTVQPYRFRLPDSPRSVAVRWPEGPRGRAPGYPGGPGFAGVRAGCKLGRSHGAGLRGPARWEPARGVSVGNEVEELRAFEGDPRFGGARRDDRAALRRGGSAAELLSRRPNLLVSREVSLASEEDGCRWK